MHRWNSSRLRGVRPVSANPLAPPGKCTTWRVCLGWVIIPKVKGHGLIHDLPLRPLVRDRVPVEGFRICISFDAEGFEF